METALYPEDKAEALRSMLFSTGEAALQDRIAGFCNSLYAMYGTSGLQALPRGIIDPPATNWDPSVGATHAL